MGKLLSLSLCAFSAFALAGCPAPTRTDPGDTAALVAQSEQPAETPSDPAAGADPAGSISDASVDAEPRATRVDPDLLYKLLLAEIAGQRGQFTVAVDGLLGAAWETDDARIAKRATRVAMFAKDFDAAVKAAGRWVELAPEDTEAVKHLALLSLRQGDADAAATELMRFVDMVSKDSSRRLDVAVSLLTREKNREAALATMEKIAETDPDSAAMQAAIGRIAFSSGDVERAESALTRALTLDARNKRALLLMADIRVQQLKYGEAAGYVARARELDPDNQQLRMTYARLLLRDDRRDEAKAEFEALVDDVPDNADAIYALALMALRSESPAQAEPLLQRLVELGKRTNEAAFYLGSLERDRKDYAKALEYFGRVKKGDLRLDAELQIAQVLADKGDIDGARANLTALREREESIMPRAFLIEAEILRKAERMDESMATYNLAVGRFPDNTDLLYARALLGEAMGDIAILERDLTRVLEIDEDNVNALNALGYTLADQTDRYEEALGLIERAHEQRPDDAAILDSMGWVNFRLGRNEDAERYLRRALSADFDGEIAAHLGEVLWATGRQDEANAIWEEALERDPDDEALKETLKRFRTQ